MPVFTLTLIFLIMVEYASAMGYAYQQFRIIILLATSGFSIDLIGLYVSYKTPVDGVWS